MQFSKTEQINKERMAMVATSSEDGSQLKLAHVHACIHCGHPRLREEVENREINSGILHCPKCGLEGPLNVQIREWPIA